MQLNKDCNPAHFDSNIAAHSTQTTYPTVVDLEDDFVEIHNPEEVQILDQKPAYTTITRLLPRQNPIEPCLEDF